MAIASLSSAPERRGQASPTAALVAVAVIGLALSLYATVLADAASAPDRDVATPTLSAVHDTVVPNGVAEPDRLPAAIDAGPEGWTLGVELRAGAARWTVGTIPPAETDAQSAGRRVPVRTAPGRVLSGWLRVVVNR